MKHKFKMMYLWLIRTLMYFWPDVPLIMRLRGWLYKPALLSVGKNFQVAHNVQLVCADGLSVGDNVYFAYGCIIIADKNVNIGNNVMFGPMCLLVCDNHSFDGNSFRFSAPQYAPIKIGANSWVGGCCVILAGSELPSNSLLAANSTLISKSFSMNQGLYGGSPAKYIKQI